MPRSPLTGAAARPPTRVPAIELPCHAFRLPARAYDLDATLSSGQAFRWRAIDGVWVGVIRDRWVQLRSVSDGIEARTAAGAADRPLLAEYLQTGIDQAGILATFPKDTVLARAVSIAPGLRILRQDPWECLASFLLSSTKQIVQIQRVIETLCRRLGPSLPTPAGWPVVYGFPSAVRVAEASERLLRDCRMGYRASSLQAAARAIAEDRFSLAELGLLPLNAARTRIQELPGVGPKIADCVLLFAYGQTEAFPIDVWIERVLREDYFAGRAVPRRVLVDFAAKHFGAHAGHAQQFLFHWARLRAGRAG